MRRIVIPLLLCLMARTFVSAENDSPTTQPAADRFTYIDIFIHPNAAGLAAYQFNFTIRHGDLVGLEGGDGAFTAAPYYDPAALAHDRVIVAAFSTEKNLPAGRVRVARLHLHVAAASASTSTSTSTEFNASLVTAADSGGKILSADLSAVEGAAP